MTTIMRIKLFVSIITLCVVLIPDVTVAQRPAIYSLEVIDSINDRSAFNAVRVVDQRVNKNSIGHLRKSYGPMAVLTVETNPKLETSKSLGDELTDYAVASIKYASKGVDTLLIVLHDFQLEMEPVNNEAAQFYFRALLFIGKQDSYKLLAAVDTLVKFKGSDIVYRASVASNEIVFKYIKLAAATNTSTLTGPSYTSATAADMLNNLKRNTPIYNLEDYKSGVYESVQDFLNHTPSTKPFLQRDNFVGDRNRPFFYYKDEQGKKGGKITTAFAIYNGERWYIRDKGIWVQFRLRDDDFYLGKDRRFSLIKKCFVRIAQPYLFVSDFGSGVKVHR